LFYTIFLNEIEPKLGFDAPTIVHHYPAQMAALSKISDEDNRYAERFELYATGVELANAFSELTDVKEQRMRLEHEQQERKNRGMSVYPLDENFLDAIEQLPPCAGIAFGLDRCIQLLLGCQSIDDVLVLPCSKLFEQK
jgi:lysyl-tRNA synthetase class 2